jgi:glycosyltransferase involved in cell wall biosynthesis
MFCYDDQGSVLGQYISQVAEELAQRNTVAHVFTRSPYTFSQANARSHAIGDCPGPDLLASAHEFAKGAREKFVATFGAGASVPLLGQEWTSIPALLEIAGQSGAGMILSLHSVEAQRSDLSSEISRKINALEVQGIAAAKTVLLHQPSTVEALNRIAPDAAKKVVLARQAFPIQQFVSTLDPGEIKKRVQVGPVDPMVLYVGPLDERHGPDLLMRAVPTIVKNYGQARFVFIGDGSLIWPLRVHARYLLLDYVTRILGHLSGQGLNELIHACDMIVVPSRELTEEWPVLAGWAASKPVVVTHNAAKGLVEHDKDGLLVYPSENSFVWGVERLLQNQELRVELGRNGHQKLQRRCGFGSTAEQVAELLGLRAASKP